MRVLPLDRWQLGALTAHQTTLKGRLAVSFSPVDTTSRHGRMKRLVLVRERHPYSRYQVAGNSNANRPKRLQSMPCQRLRAAAALILEWLRICLRQGWIAAHVRRNPEQPVARRDPEMAVRRIGSERRRLAVPYSRRPHARHHQPRRTTIRRRAAGADPGSRRPRRDPVLARSPSPGPT